jgi:type IX secretion system PorP/SprF family membrane protein
LLVLMAGFWEAGAQISPLADQYLVNGFLTNPALAGTSRYAPLLVSARLDWLGIEGAPKYQTLTYHQTILNKRQRFNPRGFLNRGDNSFGKVGIGGGAFNLSTGAISQAGIHLDYAYHVYLDKGRLSFGLAPMYHQFIIDKSRLIPPGGGTDPALENTGKEVLHFIDVNAGVHYFSKRFFAGASVVQLFNSSVWFGDLSYSSTEDNWNNTWLNRNFYTYAGLSFELGETILLEPSALLKYSEQKGIGIQANTLITINENYQMGLFWRYQQAIGFFAGIRTGNLVFRYQFESPIGSKVPVRFVSNQVLVGYLME